MIENKEKIPFMDMSEEDQKTLMELPSTKVEWLAPADEWSKIENAHEIRVPTVCYRQIEI